MNTQQQKTPASQKPSAAPNATRAQMVANDKAAKEAKEAKPAKEPKVDPILAKKILIKTEGGKNPKREGSKSHARFALYKNNQTVADYIDLAVKGGQSRRSARADIAWDQQHKFIELAD